MRCEFSENSKHLLKDSLTLETPEFSRVLAVPEWGECARMAIFNRLFTMTARCGILMPVECGCALALV
jgi:hypothetical protein